MASTSRETLSPVSTSVTVESSCFKSVTLKASTSVETLSPIPTPSIKSQRRYNRKKQSSEILTTTPMKERLLETEMRRDIKRKKLESKEKNKNVRKKLYEENELETEELEEIEGERNEDDEDICLVCGDGSKKTEHWFQCQICTKWAHALCSGWDTAEGYVCDFCDK
ncbi:hypothetical protein Zmor_021061 [Zophobas morio]|uniref:Zinc finger PHD-type domain-containing protein n=1 Tax=Zophobas morio TaxID=2755281 RepID=A0AA38MA86_9CUCU|nr:hypothetical protein Zmor_021061 [Zophobas morio]